MDDTNKTEPAEESVAEQVIRLSSQIDLLTSEIARLQADSDKLRAERDEARAETATVIAQRPATPVVASPASPHAVGAYSGRCGVCGEYHQRGQCSLCPTCRRQPGCPYPANSLDEPRCAACGSYPHVEPSRGPREIGRPAQAYMPRYPTK